MLLFVPLITNCQFKIETQAGASVVAAPSGSTENGNIQKASLSMPQTLLWQGRALEDDPPHKVYIDPLAAPNYPAKGDKLTVIACATNPRVVGIWYISQVEDQPGVLASTVCYIRRQGSYS